MATVYEFNSPPIKGSAWTFYISLISQDDPNVFKVNPTLEAGDVKVIKDGVLAGNIASLPTTISGSSQILSVSLSSSEMNADTVCVAFKDITGSSWQDALAVIYTTSSITPDVNLTQWKGATPKDVETGGYIQAKSEIVDGGITSAQFSSGAITASAIADNAITAAKIAANAIGASELASDAVDEIVDAVWDEALSGHQTVGSTGKALSNAGSAADPLTNPVPGSYEAGTAGAVLGRIGSGQISTTSIVAQSGDVETYRGDDYSNLDGRRIDWTDVSANWPTLTGSSVVIQIGGDVSFTGTVVNGVGANKKVGLELTSEQTMTIPEGKMNFVVRATLPTSNRVITLVEGIWTSKRYLFTGS